MIKKKILLILLIIGFLAISTVNAEEIANKTTNNLSNDLIDISEDDINHPIESDELGSDDFDEEIVGYKVAFFNNQTLFNLNHDDINWYVKNLTDTVHREPYDEGTVYDVSLSTFKINNVEYTMEFYLPTWGQYGSYVFEKFNPDEYDVYDGIFYKTDGDVITDIISPVEYRLFDGTNYRLVGIMAGFDEYGADESGQYSIIDNKCYKFVGTELPSGSPYVIGFFYTAVEGVDYRIVNGEYRTLNGEVIETFNKKYFPEDIEYENNDTVVNGLYVGTYDGIYYYGRISMVKYSIAPYNYIKIDNKFYQLIDGENNQYVLINDQLFNITDGVVGKLLIPSNNGNFTLYAPDVKMNYKDGTRFKVTLTDENNNSVKNRNVSIKINGQTYTKTTDSNGQASMAINLNSGVYNVTSLYNGKKVYSTLTINPTISAKNFSKIFKNATQYYATFTDSQGNLLKNTDVRFNINGVIYTRTTNTSGEARMNINLNPGTYILTAENPSNGEKYSNNITVLPNIVENYNLTKYYKNDSQYSVRLLNDVGEPAGEGVSITFNINGVFYSRSSDNNGYATLKINLGEGTYIITADYNGFKISNTIKVLPILSASDLSMSYKDGSKFAVKLLDGQGKAFAGQYITMNINGVFYERITDDSGIARLNINLLPDKYIITSTFNGFNIANNVVVNSASNSDSGSNSSNSSSNNSSSNNSSSNNSSSNNSSSNSSNSSGGYVPSDLDKAIIVNINSYNKYITKDYGNYQVKAYVYQNSNTGIDISLSNNKISGTGAYSLVDKDYYVSSIYSNMTGTWQWSKWADGYGVFGATYHRYSYFANNFVVTKVAVKVIDGLSEDGYSFYPTSLYAPDVDWLGTTRQTAIANNMHYIETIIDGKDCSCYVEYDSVNKCYHL